MCQPLSLCLTPTKLITFQKLPNMSSLLSIASTKLPSLTLRKDIWTHFPVCLVKQPTNDGRDRYAIQWHKKNLEEWSQNIPAYETVTKMRLIQSLINSTRWNVETPQNPTDICVISMNFAETQTLQTSNLPDVFAPSPVIEKLEDIRKYFPVCWKQRANGCVELEFHNTLTRRLALQHHMNESDLRKIVASKLTQVIDNRWQIEFPHERSTQICRLRSIA
jgi:hypothetical protein